MTGIDPLLPDDAANLVYLVGAGISCPAPVNIPTVLQFYDAVIDHCADGVEEVRRCQEMIRHRGKFPRFEVFVDSLHRLLDLQLEIAELYNVTGFNVIHDFLSKRAHEGAAIITTNFDSCIENAAASSLDCVSFDGTDLSTVNQPTSSVIVKVHGTARGGDNSRPLSITIRAIARSARGFRQVPNWRKYLLRLLEGRSLIVMGYSGSDDFDITPILHEASPKLIRWVQHSPSDITFRRVEGEVPKLVSLIAKRTPVESVVGDVAALLSRQKYKCRDGTRRDAITYYLRALASDKFRKTALLSLVFGEFGLHDEVLRLSKTINSPQHAVILGKSLLRLGRYQECYELSERWTEQEIPLTLRSDLYVFCSASAAYLGNSSGAAQFAEKALECATKAGDSYDRARILNHLAAVRFSASEYAEAGNLYRESLSEQRKAPNLEAEATAYWGLADVLAVKGQHDSAIGKYAQALELFEALSQEANIAWVCRNLAEEMIVSGMYLGAEQYLIRAVRVFRSNKVHYIGGLLYTYFSVVKLRIRSGNPNSAYRYLKKLIEFLSKNLDFPIAPKIVILAVLVEHVSGKTIGVEGIIPDGSGVDEVWRENEVAERDGEFGFARQCLVSLGCPNEILAKQAFEYFFEGGEYVA